MLVVSKFWSDDVLVPDVFPPRSLPQGRLEHDHNMTLAASSRGPNKTPSPPGTATQRVPNEAAQPRALNWSLAVTMHLT